MSYNDDKFLTGKMPRGEKCFSIKEVKSGQLIFVPFVSDSLHNVRVYSLNKDRDDGKISVTPVLKNGELCIEEERTIPGHSPVYLYTQQNQSTAS